jgi:hypothetical protein
MPLSAGRALLVVDRQRPQWVQEAARVRGLLQEGLAAKEAEPYGQQVLWHVWDCRGTWQGQRTWCAVLTVDN